jgi:hypothetical protein
MSTHAAEAGGGGCPGLFGQGGTDVRSQPTWERSLAWPWSEGSCLYEARSTLKCCEERRPEPSPRLGTGVVVV